MSVNNSFNILLIVPLVAIPGKEEKRSTEEGKIPFGKTINYSAII